MDLTHPKCDWNDFPDAPDWAVCVINNGAHSAFCEAFDYMARAQWLGGREFRVSNPTAFTVIASRNEPGKPEWDGEGLPPVGAEFEHSFHADGFSTWHWRKCTAVGKHGVLCIDENDTELYLNDTYNKFRPIRSEADKKKEEAIKAIDYAQSQVFDQDSTFSEYLYDAIAAGKIPHIRID